MKSGICSERAEAHGASRPSHWELGLAPEYLREGVIALVRQNEPVPRGDITGLFLAQPLEFPGTEQATAAGDRGVETLQRTVQRADDLDSQKIAQNAVGDVQEIGYVTCLTAAAVGQQGLSILEDDDVGAVTGRGILIGPKFHHTRRREQVEACRGDVEKLVGFRMLEEQVAQGI